MRTLHALEVRVTPGKMQQFTNAVQQWERMSLERPDGPEYHAVLVDADDPARVMVLSQFAGEEEARAFDATGMLAALQTAIESCCEGGITARRYDLFYAVGEGGPGAIFGELPRAAD